MRSMIEQTNYTSTALIIHGVRLKYVQYMATGSEFGLSQKLPHYCYNVANTAILV